MYVTLKLLYFAFLLLFCTSPTSLHFNLEMHTNFLKGETMGGIEYEAFRYSETIVIVFGIIGNILVILSIQRQQKYALKNNYYFLVLHLAICDAAVLIVHLFDTVKHVWRF